MFQLPAIGHKKSMNNTEIVKYRDSRTNDTAYRVGEMRFENLSDAVAWVKSR